MLIGACKRRIIKQLSAHSLSDFEHFFSQSIVFVCKSPSLVAKVNKSDIITATRMGIAVVNHDFAHVESKASVLNCLRFVLKHAAEIWKVAREVIVHFVSDSEIIGYCYIFTCVLDTLFRGYY